MPNFASLSCFYSKLRGGLFCPPPVQNRVPEYPIQNRVKEVTVIILKEGIRAPKVSSYCCFVS